MSITGNGAFTAFDLVMLQKWLLCEGKLTDWKACDFDENAVVDVFDLALMKQALLKGKA